MAITGFTLAWLENASARPFCKLLDDQQMGSNINENSKHTSVNHSGPNDALIMSVRMVVWRKLPAKKV